jgi:hypothetical protein
MKFLNLAVGYVFIQVILGLGSPASAEVDLAKVLVGRWEGTVETKNPERVLIINSVSPKDNGWIGEGRFAVPPNKGQKITINISSQDGKIVLDFEAGGAMHNPWHFTLVGDNQLEGTGNFVGGRTNRDRAAKLKKVE